MRATEQCDRRMVAHTCIVALAYAAENDGHQAERLKGKSDAKVDRVSADTSKEAAMK
jgi:hypothetical protein